ncbi:TreTu family toxin [Goodfellowiella coeruleoviolacea]
MESLLTSRILRTQLHARQARPGSRYVEFDVPCSCLKPGGAPGWALIPGPNHKIFGPLAVRRGEPLPRMPEARNIEWVTSK